MSKIKNSKALLNKVLTKNKTVINKKKGFVVMPLAEYNSTMETLYLLSSKKNADRLNESIKEMNEGKTIILNIK